MKNSRTLSNYEIYCIIKAREDIKQGTQQIFRCVLLNPSEHFDTTCKYPVGINCKLKGPLFNLVEITFAQQVKEFDIFDPAINDFHRLTDCKEAYERNNIL